MEKNGACKMQLCQKVWEKDNNAGTGKEEVLRCGSDGSMRACHAAGQGSIPGRDNFPW